MIVKTAESWITSADGSRLQEHSLCRTSKHAKQKPSGIEIITQNARQPILGFGGMFNDSAIYHFQRMGSASREAALRALFDPVTGAGWNLMRIPFGSSDWDRNWNFYTYDDMPRGKEDRALSRFSIREDIRRGHIDIIRQALAINPELKIFASVWGPPAWMKDNGRLITDGIIPPRNYRVYAKYLCRCVQAYQEHGIPILAVSPQNEPLCIDGRKTPQALWVEWKPMRDFFLVMADEFQKHHLKSQIWAHDHNFCYVKKYVAPMLADVRLRTAIDAMAWHDYEGNPADMGILVRKYPHLPMYHTECSLYGVGGMLRIIALLRNGARSHNHWTTIQDEYGAPHQYKGGSELTLKPLEEGRHPALVAPRNRPDKWRTTIGHHIFGHLTRFVKRGAVRLETKDGASSLANVAFRNVDGTIAVVAANNENAGQTFSITVGDREVKGSLPAQSVGTWCVW